MYQGKAPDCPDGKTELGPRSPKKGETSDAASFAIAFVLLRQR